MDTEQAVDKAISFAKKHGNPQARLINVEKKGKIWYIKLDVGTLLVSYVTVQIDEKGIILSMK
jgi:hypothetical protein